MFQISKLWRAAEPADQPMHWDTALQILQTIDPRLATTGRDASQVSAGVAVPLEGTLPEDRAFEIQVRVLEYAIQLRKAVHGPRKLELAGLPQDQGKEKAKSEEKRATLVSPDTDDSAGLEGTAATVRDLIARIEEDTIRSKAQNEIVADYWNKLAFIAWERATLPEAPNEIEWLQRARTYIDIVKTVRPNWSPAQLNEARILAAEGKTKEAQDTLEKVLGKKKDAKPSPPPPPAPDSDAIAGVVLKMAVERNPKAVAAHIQRSYGALSQDTVRKITEALAGKVDAGLLDDILSGVPIKTESVPK